MSESLQKHSSESLTTAKSCSQTSVLLQMLDMSAKIMGREIMPGELRLWQETFKDVNPKTLEKAFRDYLKLGKFFPKPGDIWERIEDYRERMKFECEERENQKRKAEIKEAQEAGELVSPAELNRILYEAAQKIKSMPKVRPEGVTCTWHESPSDAELRDRRNILNQQRAKLGVTEVTPSDKIPPELRKPSGTVPTEKQPSDSKVETTG